jgi:phytoene dehydrogenase-like protein
MSQTLTTPVRRLFVVPTATQPKSSVPAVKTSSLWQRFLTALRLSLSTMSV